VLGWANGDICPYVDRSGPLVSTHPTDRECLSYYNYYNFARIHKTLRITPSMAAALVIAVESYGRYLHAEIHYARPS
jgi:hypothetical protein